MLVLVFGLWLELRLGLGLGLGLGSISCEVDALCLCEVRAGADGVRAHCAVGQERVHLRAVARWQEPHLAWREKPLATLSEGVAGQCSDTAAMQ